MQAVALLHPDGPKAAAADEAREATEAEQAAAAAARYPAKVAKMALRQGSLISEAPSGTPKSGVGLPPRLGSASMQPAVPADTPSCTDVDDFQVCAKRTPFLSVCSMYKAPPRASKMLPPMSGIFPHNVKCVRFQGI